VQTNIPLIAHRGESFDAPENTLAAFALAWERGNEAIELDVHLTTDGQLIVSHDADTLRTTGQKLIIADSSLARLQQLGLPSLDEVLKQMPHGKRVFVEIKIGLQAIDPLVKLLKHRQRPANEIAIISFNTETVRRAKQSLPDHEVYLLVDKKLNSQTNQWKPDAATMIQQAMDLGADGLDVGIHPSVDANLVEQAHAAGLKLLVWTIDDPAVAREMVRLGVDGITTNRAAWMRGQLGLP
jgi:glycerophosphoryl diester phosphodiesterase